MQPMMTRVEVWPLAADPVGIWLCAPDAWRPSTPIMSDSQPHDEVVLELARQGVTPGDTAILHSTSWRVDGQGVILTYVAVLNTPGPSPMVRAHYPLAQPLALEMHKLVGRPAAHAPDQPPVPRRIDVLLHGVRHLRFLRDNDAQVSRALGDWWHTHLDQWAPALFAMYHDQPRQEAA